MENEAANVEILRLHALTWKAKEATEARVKHEALKHLKEFENVGEEESLKVLKENDITTYEALSAELIKLEAQMEILEELHMNLDTEEQK